MGLNLKAPKFYVYETCIPGHYLHIEATNIDENDVATLISPTFYGAACVSFYYHSYGQHTGKLMVRERNAYTWDKVIFEIEGFNGQYG